MRKSNFKILALTAALIMPLSSCKETIIYVTPEDTPNDDIKTPIELSVGGVDGAVESSSTRAVITDDNTKTYNPFDKDTKIFMVMKSTYDTNNPDYLGSRKDKYTVSRGLVSAGQTNVRFEDGSNQKYWDDAHARSSQLEIWAFAQQATWDNYTFEIPDPTKDASNPLTEYKDQTFYGTTVYNWKEHDYNNGDGDKGSKGPYYPCIMVWKVTNTPWTQTANSIQYQDLMFSNNLANNGTGKDCRLKFSNKQAGKFDTGEMKFYHAMSKLTINIIEGEGFDKTSQSDFQFATGKNIKLNGFNTQGTFNIKNGYFEKVEETRAEITSIAQTSPKGVAPNPYYTLQALAIPNINGINNITDTYSRFDKDASNTMMEFTIDNNTFKITSGALYNALHKRNSDGSISNDVVDNATKVDNTYIPLEAGKNYIFTFVVGKTKIEHLTATVAQWKDIEAESFTPIIDVSQNYGEKGSESDLNKTYTLLRSTSKAGSYGNGSCSDGNSAKMEYNTTDNKYNAMAPQLYWPDHKTHYFFRGVYPEVKTSAQTGYPTIDTEGKTISVTNCAYETGSSPSDLMIGIPRKSNGDLDETCKVTGTNHGTSVEGICATSGNINLNFRYAMSQVEVRLTTNTATGATDAVNIATAKVEVINGCNGGAIKLEDSSVASRTTGDFTIGMTTTDTETKGNSSVIPQSLTNGSNNLRFKITIYKEGSTTEEIDDIYYADIKDIQVKEGTSTTSKAITSWEAGKHYIYTLNLKKTEIKVSATITDWVTATGSTNVWF